ncbi:MAG: hypothetical protein V3W14_08455 [Candidatus Neomarinimicrobiota bacterium]
MIADGTHVRALGGLPGTMDDNVLSNFFGPAARRLKEWVGEAAYTDAELATPVDPDRAAALKDAEAYLVLYFAVPRMNMVMTGSGIVTYKTDGMSSDEFTYLKPGELEELRQVWLRDAGNACRPHIIPSGVTIGVSPAVEDES